MPVTVAFVNGSGIGSKKLDAPGSAYKITESGCLQLLVIEGAEWIVRDEYSPNQWQSVQGTRYTADTSRLRGTDGTAAPPSAYEGRGAIIV